MRRRRFNTRHGAGATSLSAILITLAKALSVDCGRNSRLMLPLPLIIAHSFKGKQTNTQGVNSSTQSKVRDRNINDCKGGSANGQVQGNVQWLGRRPRIRRQSEVDSRCSVARLQRRLSSSPAAAREQEGAQRAESEASDIESTHEHELD